MPPTTRPLRETRLQIVERNKREIEDRRRKRIASLFDEARLKEIEKARLELIEIARQTAIADKRSVCWSVCGGLYLCLVILLLAKWQGI